MLNTDALAQLKGLKDQLEAQKEHTEATVKGTQIATALPLSMTDEKFSCPPTKCSKCCPAIA